jgi:negative regulator of sigma E activity
MRMIMAILIVKVTQMAPKRAVAAAAAAAVVVVVVVVVVAVAGKQAESRRVNGTTVSPQHQMEGYQYQPLGRAVTSG